jgi:hypothetical protein
VQGILATRQAAKGLRVSPGQWEEEMAENGETAEALRYPVDEFRDPASAAHRQVMNIVRQLAR